MSVWNMIRLDQKISITALLKISFYKHQYLVPYLMLWRGWGESCEYHKAMETLEILLYSGEKKPQDNKGYELMNIPPRNMSISTDRHCKLDSLSLVDNLDIGYIRATATLMAYNHKYGFTVVYSIDNMTRDSIGQMVHQLEYSMRTSYWLTKSLR